MILNDSSEQYWVWDCCVHNLSQRLWFISSINSTYVSNLFDTDILLDTSGAAESLGSFASLIGDTHNAVCKTERLEARPV